MPRGDKPLELPHKDSGCWGVWQGDLGEEPVRVDVTEVSPEGCHQLARGRGSVDAVEHLSSASSKGPAPPCCVGRAGGGGMAIWCWSSVAPAGEGCREMVPGCPPGVQTGSGNGSMQML